MRRYVNMKSIPRKKVIIRDITGESISYYVQDVKVEGGVITLLEDLSTPHHFIKVVLTNTISVEVMDLHD